ncbi:CRISPR-associated endoribonuclease Cas6 [Candidatus Pacearchaeota archaeon]|nr:MAG: CRISPR-associated endoribonuclease Cas6 [Candidatus Pacearchaeota archaeon]
MRISIKLKSKADIGVKDFYYKFNSAINSFIHNRISALNLHDSKGYKPFCFGNLYPVKDRIEQGKIYEITIASPLPQVISELILSFRRGEKIGVGEGFFELCGAQIRKIQLKRGDCIYSVSPIVIKEKGHFVDYSKERERFIFLLNRNLLNKYNFFNKTSITSINLFANVKIKPIKNRFLVKNITTKDKDIAVAGYALSFRFGKLSETSLKVLNYVFDLGFGIKNTYGFGFMIKKLK